MFCLFVCLFVVVYDDATPGAKAPVTLLPGYASSFPGYGGDEEGEGTVVLGTISIAPEISWITMDTKVCDIFMVCPYNCHTTHSLFGD